MLHGKLEDLTKREREVLKCVSQGLRNKEIARTLFIVESTVEDHLDSIYRKWNIGNRTEAVIIALRSGLEI